MKLRNTFRRRLRRSLQWLGECLNPTAAAIVKVLNSGKVKIRSFGEITKEDYVRYFEESLTPEQRAHPKKALTNLCDGCFCGPNTIYIDSELEHEDFTDTLVHEVSHYLSHEKVSDDPTDILADELAARVIADKALGKYLTRYRLKSHIQEMKKMEYFTDNPTFEATDFQQTETILKRLGLNF